MSKSTAHRQDSLTWFVAPAISSGYSESRRIGQRYMLLCRSDVEIVAYCQ
jgi:hypothetical protein